MAIDNFRSLVKPWEYDFTQKIQGLSGAEMAFWFTHVYGRNHAVAISEYCLSKLKRCIGNYSIIDVGSGPFIGLKACVEGGYNLPFEYIGIDRSDYFLEYGKTQYSNCRTTSFQKMSDFDCSSSDRPILVIMSYFLQNRYFNEKELVDFFYKLRSTGREIELYIQDTSTDYFNVNRINKMLLEFGFYPERDWAISINPNYRMSKFKSEIRHATFSNTVSVESYLGDNDEHSF